MQKELQESLKATAAAFVPAMAVQTSETMTFLDEVCTFAAKTCPILEKHEGQPRRVFVWRVSEGFQEYGLMRDEEVNGKLDETHYPIVTESDPDEGYYASPLETPPEKPEEEWDGATVPFAIHYIRDWDVDKKGGAIFVLRDWHNYISHNTMLVDEQLSLFETNAERAELKTVIMMSPVAWVIPPELNDYVTVTDMERPDKQWRTDRVLFFKEGILADKSKVKRYPKMKGMTDEDAEDVADALAGLTRTEAESHLCMSLAVRDFMDVPYILKMKERNIRRQGFNLIRPKESFEDVGGLAPLKEWISRQKMRFTEAAKEYGFPRFPRGLLMAGVPGCGKSLIAKTIAKEWNMNILQVQATDLKGSLVGESEAKVDKLLKIAKAAAPIVVFIDEAEKLLGSQDSVRDGGAHDAVMAQFLSFMQDNESGVYFVFTANQMRKFSPELVDRFEGRWFVDLPTDSEREYILEIHLQKRKQDYKKLDMKKLVDLTEDFSGRNIEDAIEEAMSIAFCDNRATVMKDYSKAFRDVLPTSKTKKTEIEEMREYVANGTMRLANTPTESKEKRSRVRGFA